MPIQSWPVDIILQFSLTSNLPLYYVPNGGSQTSHITNYIDPPHSMSSYILLHIINQQLELSSSLAYKLVPRCYHDQSLICANKNEQTSHCSQDPGGLLIFQSDTVKSSCSNYMTILTLVNLRSTPCMGRLATEIT